MADYHSGAQLLPQAGRHGESTSQVTACHRCRKQKLRCSRETPSCKRCLDISAACSYPPPPDRKLLAAQRAQNAKARSVRESRMAVEQRDYSGKSGTGSEGQPPSEQDSDQSLRQPTSLDHGLESMPEDSPPSMPPSASATLLQVSHPSRELALSLIEIYFTHMWNSTLLFHKESLASDYFSGRVLDSVALSVFALGAVYLYDIAGPNVEYMPSFPGSQRPGEDWARAASQQVLMNADQPQYEVVQACQNLAMYWYAVGEMNRTNLHHHIAYRTCRLLGYHALHVDETGVDRFHVELKRRAFWASWSMSCLSQNNACFRAESWAECVGLPFPSDELSFSQRRPAAKEAFDDDGRLELVEGGKPEHSRTSYLGEMMKLLSLWWEIQNFTKKYVDTGPLESLKRMSQLQELDQQLEQIRDNLNSDFQYVDQSSFASHDINHSYQLFTVHVMHHTSVCVLHSSIVPLFSNIAPDPRISKKLTKLSAEEAIKHSQKLVNMATQLLGIYPDPARCPAFSGYAMFVAVSVQFKALGAQGLLRSDNIGHLYPAISILEKSQRVWVPSNYLWKTLDKLFRGAGIDIHRLSETRQLLARSESHTNIDHIATHGVVIGNTDMYTYIPDTEPKSGSSRHSSASLSAAGSPSPQHFTPQRQPSSNRAKIKEAIPRIVNTSAPISMPHHTRQDHQMHWPGQQTQSHEFDQGGNMLQQHDSPHGAPLGLMYSSQPSESVGGGGQGFQNQMPGIGYMGVDMGMNLTMGMDNMDLDSSNANLWWDQPFEDIPAESYGWWYTETYQAQGQSQAHAQAHGYQLPDVNGYYQS